MSSIDSMHYERYEDRDGGRMFLLVHAAFFSLIASRAETPVLSPIQTSTQKVDAQVLVVDGSSPDACLKLKEFLKRHSSQLSISERKRFIRASGLCQKNTPAEKKLTEFYFLAPSPGAPNPNVPENPPTVERVDPYKLKLELNGGFAQGNYNFGQYKAGLKFEKHWGKKLLLELSHSAEYRSDQKEKTVFASEGAYYYLLSRHWAVFALAGIKHDGPKKIDFQNDAYLGAIVNFLPFGGVAAPKVTLSVAPGYRYERYTSDLDSLSAVMSYRLSFKKYFSRKMSLISVFWYQHLLASRTQEDVKKGIDFEDYRVLFELKLTFEDQFAEGIGINVGFEDEYFSEPPVNATSKNDLRGTVGLTFSW